MLINRGSPPLLGYALACSVAWHSRQPTVYVHGGDQDVPAPLRAIVDAIQPRSTDELSAAPMAEARLYRIDDQFAPERVEATVEQLGHRYAHVLIETATPEAFEDIDSKQILLTGPGSLPDQAPAADYAVSGWEDAGDRVGPDRFGRLCVPEPEATELDAIARGNLTLDGPAGRAIGWAARDIARYKIGVAFGAGAIKGYAHVGVLQALETLKLPIDYVAGTSVGAAIAASYSLGFSPRVCGRILDQVGKRAFRMTVPRHGMLSSDGLRDGIKRVARNRKIEDSRIPLAIVAADLNSGREVVFKDGLIWPAVLASMSIPGVYPPIPVGGQMLVDGGVVNPVPSDAVSALGANIVIAIKLSRREIDHPWERTSVEPSGRAPVIFQTLTRSIEIMQGKIVTESAAAATITVEPTFPDLSGWGLRDFGNGGEIVDVGIQAATDAHPRLTATIPWLRR